MGTRSTNARKLLRLREVQELLLRALPRHEIVFELTNRWGCNARAVDSYIRKCKELIQKKWSEEMDSDISNHYDDLIRVAIDNKDPYLRKAVLDSKVKLRGVVNKVEITGQLEINTIKLKEIIKPQDTDE